jgi:hypothetical protein
MTGEPSGAMSPATQIDCSVQEAMKNVALAIFGENFAFTVTFEQPDTSVGDRAVVVAKAEGWKSKNYHQMVATASLIIRFPDREDGGYRIDDTVFTVRVSGREHQGSQFEAWCEHNPYNGAKVIVRQVYPDARERFIIADSMEGEILFRGIGKNMPDWARVIVSVKWANIPHLKQLLMGPAERQLHNVND